MASCALSLVNRFTACGDFVGQILDFQLGNRRNACLDKLRITRVGTGTGFGADADIARKQDDDENGYDKSQDNNGDKLARRLDKRAVLFALCIAHVSSARMTKTDIIMTW